MVVMETGKMLNDKLLSNDFPKFIRSKSAQRLNFIILSQKYSLFFKEDYIFTENFKRTLKNYG